MESTFHLRLLGPVQVDRQGEPVLGFRSRKALALLAYLAVQGRPVGRERLVDLFWGDRSEARGRANLSWVLHRISALLPGCLEADRHTVGFRRAAGHRLDIDDFEDLEAQGEGTSLEAAAELYRGEFLEGLVLEGCAEFEIWLVGERQRWRQRMARVLGELVAHYSECGEYEQGLHCARRLLAMEPWREEAHRQLMRLLALSGQRSAALAQYEACRRTLMEEVGVEPSEETTALWQRIRDGLELPSPARGPPHNLPTPLTPLIGRQAELAEIQARLQDPACRLLSLVGPGGSGKTHLALEAARKQIPNFRHGVFFVSLAPLQSLDAIVPTVAQALGFPLTTGAERDPRRQLLDYLRGKRMLLILDNFEHLLEGVRLVTQILRRALEVKIMTTSRARLNVQGEHLLPVLGLDAPSDIAEAEPQYLSRYAAVQLFLSSARRVRAAFEPTADDLSQVARICRLVEGMPLAILMAASWMTMLRPAEIGVQISRRSLDFLETEWRDVPRRQRSVRAVFDHSWSLLSERQRAVFAGLSVFRGGFLCEAAQQVTGASLRELVALVDRSLLQRTPTGRYEVHELLRQYGAEKLAVSPAAEEVRDRHCAHYAEALQRREADLRGARQKQALAEMEADIGNARVAWNWAVERGDVEHIAQAMEGLCRFYERRGRNQEGEAACRVAAEKLKPMEEELTGDELRALARALGWQGVFNRIMGRTELARGLLEQGLALLDDPRLAAEEPVLSLSKDTGPERAFLLQQLGRIVYESDRHQAARPLWEQSLALYGALSDRWGTANVLDDLGELAQDIGDYDEAKHLHGESLAIRRSLGDQMGIAGALSGLSVVAQCQGQLEEAERLVREGIVVHREIGDRAGLAIGLLVLASTLVYLGKFAEAHRQLEEAVALQDDLGMRAKLGHAKYLLALAKVSLGSYEEARVLAQDGLALFREMDDRRGVGVCLLGLGEIALVEEDYAGARHLLQDSVTAYREIGQRDELSLALIDLGHAERGLGGPGQAQRYLVEAMRTAVDIGAFEPSLYSLCLMALLLADRGEVERAIELYALASRYPYVGNSQFWEDITGKHIAALAATLPPEVVAAAQERGRARDLEATVAELLTQSEAVPEDR